MAIVGRKYHVAYLNIFAPILINETKIVIAYPNVFINLLCCFNNKINFPASKISYINIIHKWNLTNIFCVPWLTLIILVIESEYRNSLALLLAMAVALNSYDKLFYVSTNCYVIHF